MFAINAKNELSWHDRLITRPDVPLPTPLDPGSPRARGAPADPRPPAQPDQGDAEATNQTVAETGGTA